MLTFRTLGPRDVECRVARCTEKGAQLLIYKTARTDMDVLDKAVGPENWECSYEQIGGVLFCTISIKDGYGNWVSKQDCGTPSNMEADKGNASDAFKRAGFKWGVGRELYTAPFIWIPSDRCTVKKNNRGKWVCYDRFEVAEMGVEDGTITSLEIASNGRTVWKKAEDNREPLELREAKVELTNAINDYAQANGLNQKELYEGVRQRVEFAERCEDPEWWRSVAGEFR